jgi:arabinogalactan endo-1,4-beta-galactosidase
MLSFHFSSTWAAPSHQAMPKSWVDAEGKNLTGTALESKLRKYVSDTLTVMHKTGADIAYVALGNEISTGMLWPSGALHLQGIRASEIMGDFAKLWKNARLGVEDFSKITNKSPRVMLHLNNGWSEAIVCSRR